MSQNAARSIDGMIVNPDPRQTPLTRRLQIDGLSIEASGRAADGVLDAFFPAYDAAFVLPNEKEAIDGFRDCLALNAGPVHTRLSARYGDFQEVVLVARAQATGPVLGGANFLLLSDVGGGAGAQPQPSLNLNYLFVDRAARGQGLSRTLLRACRQISDDWSGIAGGALCFLELNDPFRLSDAEYRLDSEHAGIDQLSRLAYWARLGCAVLDWPYVQPALSDAQGDDDTLAYALLDAPPTALPAAVVHAHLERFFAISVLKGEALHGSPSAQRQLDALKARAKSGGTVALHPLTPALGRLPTLLQRTSRRPARLADALREPA